MERTHMIILKTFLSKLPVGKIQKVLDAGSGKTSLSALLRYFPTSQIDAVVYPGDERKINSIHTLDAGNSVEIIEHDLCESIPEAEYDLTLAHLLLGEATKFGNTFEHLLKELLSVHSHYLIIIDYLEDPTVDIALIVELCLQYGWTIEEKAVLENEEPQVWGNFTGEHNFGYLLSKEQQGRI